MLSNLPIESAFVSESVGNGLPWNAQTELLAEIIEQQSDLIRIQLARGGVKQHALPKRRHIRRPWEKPADEKPKLATVSEIKAFMKRGAAKGRR